MRSIIIALGVLAVCASVATADVVVLKNGDRVTGIIESLADGKLHIKTDAMAEVTIDMAKVMTFSTDEPIVLVFKDGTVVHQKVAAAGDGMVAVQAGGLLAPQDLALADLAAANPPEAKVKWTGHLTFGATKTTGNSRSTTASGDASLERRTEDDRITVNGYYLFAQSEDPSTNIETTTTDKWFIEVAYDYFVSKKLFVLADVNYMKNRIANLDGRAIGTLGMGYQWVESKPMNFNTNLSFGGMHESYTHPDRNDDTIVGQIGWHFDRALTDTLTFLHDFRLNPDLEKPRNEVLETSVELRAALYKAIFASFKVLIDYDSQPAAGQERTDTAYILGVGINF
ncbi:MAG: YdiY family protein [Candidatus Brocadiia bacterium]